MYSTLLLDASGVVAQQWFTQQTPRVFLLNPDLRLLYRGAIDNFTILIVAAE